MKRRVLKVLLVGKYPAVRAGMRAMLKAPDIRVGGEAGTPDEALRRGRARPPDILLVHLRVGEGHSLDFLAAVKEKWPKASVVILTGNEEPAFLSQALALGCSGYIHESVEPRELSETVRAIARGECVIEPRLLRGLLEELARQPVRQPTQPRVHLTVPEQQVLRLIAEGQTNRQIAQRLHYSLGTVKDYAQKIIQKLGVSDRTQAAVKAVRLGLLN